VATINALDVRLRRLSDRLLISVANTVEALTIEIGAAVVHGPPGNGTPVLTGFARANWRPSIGAPAAVPVTALDPTGTGTVAKITAIAKRAGINDTVFITNNAPYIGALAGGSSPQAPAGFVDQAVQTGTEKALAKIRRRGLL
jgi:Mrp family chromosome partitioning ATPase